jgi:hypothetical protein
MHLFTRLSHSTFTLLLLSVLIPNSSLRGRDASSFGQSSFDQTRTPQIAVKPAGQNRHSGRPLYTYTLTQDGTRTSYDEALAVASLQGILNRDAPEFYVLARTNSRPRFWLDLLSKDGRWLQGRNEKPLPGLDSVVKLAGKRVKGAIIWDPEVPATVNVGTTMAGVEDAVLLSPELAARNLSKWKLHVLADLRGKFTGKETGSKKNDAYRWAIREYLASSRCSSHRLCLFEDSFSTREKGGLGYVVTRDWAVKNRSFVFDLSPWVDETPADDPQQKVGLDSETYKMILTETLHQAGGQHMTELTGFFTDSKYSNVAGHHSAHEGVPTEWESVWLMSPFNVYQNTISSDCFNQSFHSQAPRHMLKQRRKLETVPLENKAYICILMTDYDSATPLYDFLPSNWQNADRGALPLGWGIDPSLLETYPDLIAYFYETASAADTFTADASAAGYLNPNRIQKEFLPLFVRHNQKFFKEADMSIAPMVLDQDQPSPEVKDAFQQFSPNGFATIVDDQHHRGGRLPSPQVWKGMPVTELLNDACNSKTGAQIAGAMANAIRVRGNPLPGFYLFRTVWVNPTTIKEAMTALRHAQPDLDFKVLPPDSFFGLFKETLQKEPNKSPR